MTLGSEKNTIVQSRVLRESVLSIRVLGQICRPDLEYLKADRALAPVKAYSEQQHHVQTQDRSKLHKAATLAEC